VHYLCTTCAYLCVLVHCPGLCHPACVSGCPLRRPGPACVASAASPRCHLGPHRSACVAFSRLRIASARIAPACMPRLGCFVAHRASPPLSRLASRRTSPPVSRLASYVGPCFLCRTLLPMSDLTSCVAPRLLRRASPPASRLASCVAPHLLRRTSPPASHLASCIAPHLLGQHIATAPSSTQQLLHLGRPAIAGSFECRSCLEFGARAPHGCRCHRGSHHCRNHRGLVVAVVAAVLSRPCCRGRRG